MEVLEKERAILAHSLRTFWVLDGTSIGGGVNWLVFIPEGARWLIVHNHLDRCFLINGSLNVSVYSYGGGRMCGRKKNSVQTWS